MTERVVSLANSASPVRVTTSELISLNRASRIIKRSSSRVLARQSGEYLSNFKGRGMEFDESRLYQAGDDIRNMDWRVTARTGKPHTKIFREEKERPVFVWVDFRAPMFFATRGVFKSVFAAKAAALIGWNACQQGDRIGGVVFSESNHHELKPMPGKKAVLRLIHQLVDGFSAEADQEAASSAVLSLKKSILRLNRLVRPGSLVYMLSDFRGLQAAQAQLSALSQHCEIIMLVISDPVEAQLPEEGIYRFSDQKNEVVINTYDQTIREKYQNNFDQHQTFLEEISTRYRIRLVRCSTVDDPVWKLSQHAF